MLIKIDRVRAAALLRVARTDDGKVLRDLLDEVLAKTKDLLVTAGPDSIGRLQGRAQAFGDLIESFDAAPEVLRKLDERP